MQLLHFGQMHCFPFLSIFQDFVLALGLTSHSPHHTFYIRCIRSLVFLLPTVSHPLVQPLCYVEAISFFFSDMQTFSSILPLSILQWFPTVLRYHIIFLLEGTRGLLLSDSCLLLCSSVLMPSCSCAWWHLCLVYLLTS